MDDFLQAFFMCNIRACSATKCEIMMGYFCPNLVTEISATCLVLCDLSVTFRERVPLIDRASLIPTHWHIFLASPYPLTARTHTLWPRDLQKWGLLPLRRLRMWKKTRTESAKWTVEDEKAWLCFFLTIVLPAETVQHLRPPHSTRLHQLWMPWGL